MSAKISYRKTGKEKKKIEKIRNNTHLFLIRRNNDVIIIAYESFISFERNMIFYCLVINFTDSFPI